MWEAEVRARWSRLGDRRHRSLLFRIDVVGRALGAASHAVFLRLREWTPEILVQDLRFAIRALTRRPIVTLVAIVTLTIGIGATTTVFSLVESILLRPLPYPQPDRLVMVWQTLPEPGGERANASLPNLVDWRSRAGTLEAIAATTTGGGLVTITGGDEPRRVPAASVTDDFFDVLGVRPILGRGFLPGENDPAAPPVAVLSHRMWVRDFGAREDVLGRTLEISGDGHAIVGVAPPSLAIPDPGVEVWRPLRPENGLVVSGPVGRDGYVVRAVARLAPGATVASAQAEMDAISEALEREYPTTNEGVGAWVRPLHEEVVRGARPILLVLLGAVAILLLIACANVANLQLFRSVERRREMTVRTALGAGRLRLSRQLLTEGVVLGLAGGAGGLLLAAIGLRAVVPFLPADLPRTGSVAIEATVLWFTAGVSLLTTVLFGLGPAIRSTRVELVTGIQRTPRRGRFGLGGPVVIAQLALALILGTGAGLLVKSLWKLNAVDPGLDSRGVVTMRMRVTSPSLSGPGRSAFFADVVRRVRSLPETSAAGLIQHAPFGGGTGGARPRWTAMRRTRGAPRWMSGSRRVDTSTPSTFHCSRDARSTSETVRPTRRPPSSVARSSTPSGPSARPSASASTSAWSASGPPSSGSWATSTTPGSTSPCIPPCTVPTASGA